LSLLRSYLLSFRVTKTAFPVKGLNSDTSKAHLG
jgi:hypothetical protein